MSFSYNELDCETRIVVQQKTGEIKSLLGKTALSIVAIGRKLIEVKGKLNHGLFGSWLDQEFAWSEDTAERFTRVARRFKDNPQIAEFAPSALYLLSAPSVPDEVREEATKKAEAGEKITHKTAKGKNKKAGLGDPHD